MKEENVTGVLIDVKTGTASTVTIKDELNEYYKILDCKYIDIYGRKVGKCWYSIVCDDEGALREGATVSAIGLRGEIAFYGNLFILGKVQDDGELHSLTDEEHINLMKNISKEVVYSNGEKEIRTMLFNVEYR